MKGKLVNRILFAVDLTERSEQAVTTVARIAQLAGAEVLVIHVWTPHFSTRKHNWDMAAPRAVSELLARNLKELKAAGVKAASEMRAAGPDGIAGEIVAASNSYGADLIVVGSRGLSNISGLFLGSVSHQVLARSDIPVLVVRGGSEGSGRPIRRIVLAVAGDDEVLPAVEATIAIAAPAKATVLALHARYLLPAGMRGVFVEPEEDSAALVDGIVRQLKEAGIEVKGESQLDRYGVASEIVDTAKAWHADLIVIGSRRLSDLAAIVFGSTDHAVIRRADRPVLVARRADTKGRTSTTRPKKDSRSAEPKSPPKVDGG